MQKVYLSTMHIKSADTVCHIAQYVIYRSHASEFADYNQIVKPHFNANQRHIK